MFYAASFQDLVELRDQSGGQEFNERCEAIVTSSASSGLEAVGWGLAFPDLLNLLAFVSIDDDRGEAIERTWKRELNEHHPGLGSQTLAGWRSAAASHQMPLVVFNATDVESGRRVFFFTSHRNRGPGTGHTTD